MITAIKIAVMLAVIFLLCYPLITAKSKLFVASRLKYRDKHTRKNLLFVFLVAIELAVVILLFSLFDTLAWLISSIPFVGELLVDAIDSINSHVDYIFLTIKIVLINLVLVYAYLLLKAFVKKAILDPAFGINKEKVKLSSIFKRKSKEEKAKDAERKKKKTEDNGKDDQSDQSEDEDAKKKKRRIPDFIHTVFEDEDAEGEKKDSQKVPSQNPDGNEEEPKEEKKQYGRFASRILSVFFEGDQFQFARLWVVRTRMILQGFVRLIEILYLLLLTVMMTSVFFSLPMPLYNLLIDILHVGDWYLYPILSILFLQEICNTFDLPLKEEEIADKKKTEEEEEDQNREGRIRALLSELKKRFDAEHSLRYYPEVHNKEVPEYKCTNVMYASALEYIGKQMEHATGRVVQSYMESLDAIYGDSHVYFPASFYSEFGEYMIAYTYIRLLSGARMIFVVSDPAEKDTLRTYISDRLIEMTGGSALSSWRVYTANERLDQADVLIVTPDEFISENIIDQYPGFFEEACNAVFIDADKMVATDSYVCPIIASRLKKATSNRIRFVFLSLDLLKGFAARNLPKLFCVDKVLSFSSANENEAVSYVLWNRESKKRRIYNKSGQKSASLETIIAEQALNSGIDGVRVISESALEHSDKKILAMHDVEINNLYKRRVNVNYMIFSDDRCNLAAALYACTRFRGLKKSVVHIISKPYLLREYFVSKSNSEDYINRSSFIQPRVTEHAENHKLSLLKIFCDVTAEGGLPVEEFERRMKAAIAMQKEKGEKLSSVFCKALLKGKNFEKLKLAELAAYLVAGLCDNDSMDASEEEQAKSFSESLGNRAKDFYLVIDPANADQNAPVYEKKIIFNRAKEVFAELFKYSRRVELRLNDALIGVLDTFPGRVHYEYVVGQSIIYKNSEYEIEHIAEDGSAIYLRHENISIRNCLDTVVLRHYDMHALVETGKTGVLNHSTSKVEEIKVVPCKADFEGTVYGFYSLTPDRQTLDFYSGVEGNPNIDHPYVNKVPNRNVLRVSLKTRMECTDGMRRLLAAVFNEFIRTIFPRAYRCVAICPILAEPDTVDMLREQGDTPLTRIKTLYPFIKNPTEEFIETDSSRMQFLFINDCEEDIGALDWFFDPSGRYMQEFLANVYSYLHWLKLHTQKQHFIYYGGTELPECYDLEGCCELLADFNLVLSDDGERDFETAGDDEASENIEYCSFCHKQMESGRYSLFDDHRFICADCFETVDEQSKLEELYDEMLKYLREKYPMISFNSLKVGFDSVYSLDAKQTLSEYYYRMDYTDRAVFVEVDNPVNNVRVSLLRAIVSMWQSDASLIHQYAPAQLYFEELEYLRSANLSQSADWIYENLPEELRKKVDEIRAYVGIKDTAQSEEPVKEDNEDRVDEIDEQTKDESENQKDESELPDQEGRTSFMFMSEKAKELKEAEEDENKLDDNTDTSDDEWFDPNGVPRFWKRYLRGQRIDNGEDETPSEPEDEDDSAESDDVVEEEKTPVNSFLIEPLRPNAPPPETEEEELASELEEEPQKDEEKTEKNAKKLSKEEKKRLKEEKRKKKHEEWLKKMGELDAEEEQKEKELNGNSPKKEKKEKRGFFGFGKKKKQAEEEPDDKKLDDEKLDDKKLDDKKLDDKKLDDEKLDDEKLDDKKLDDEKLDDEKLDDEKLDDEKLDDEKLDDEKLDDKAAKKKAKKEKKEQKQKAKKKKGLFGRGSRTRPQDDDEATNPKIRLYNAYVQAAYDYSDEKISREGVTDEDVGRILQYVKHDYPELFWLDSYRYNSAHVSLTYRFVNSDGSINKKEINRKRAEIRKGAKPFLKGLSSKTDPYEAVLTVYRRLILTLDYDHIGLQAQADKDKSKDDVLRSLHSALVEHKVVCAGYAVAMQYLLQSLKIVCGYVVSEDTADGTSCHAFNILKIGKNCYYLDATWGDTSSTRSDDNKDMVRYDYFCTPYKEFIRTTPDRIPMHIPRKEYYPDFEELNYTKHEYFRFHNAYVESYNEREIIRIFADAALRYDPKEMGRFMVGFRCTDGQLAKHIYGILLSKNKIFEIMQKAKEDVAKKDKKAAKLLDMTAITHSYNEQAGTVYIFAPSNPKKGK